MLEQFINDEEPKYFNKEKRNKRKRAEEAESEEFEPEEAFLKIGSNLRQVFSQKSQKKLSLIFASGTEAPAASGNAARHRGEA